MTQATASSILLTTQGTEQDSGSAAAVVQHPAKYALEWRQGFCTGVGAVDAEHRHLFELVKKLELETVHATLDELLEYVVTHFTNEQALMERSGYPDFHQHLALHEQLAAQVSEFLSAETIWTEQRLHKLRRFLNQWLVGHILTHDLRFGRWYLENAKARKGHAHGAHGNGERPGSKSRWLLRLLRRA